MMAADQFAGATLFTGGAFMPSQSIDSSISPSKIRTPQTLIPMTVKQIIEAYHSSEDKSAIIVDGVELANVKLVGLVMNRMERDTEVSFTLDDGTGRIDISRWLLTDFNDIVLHFVECIHVHLGHIRLKMNINMSTSYLNGMREYLAPLPNQFLAHSSVDGLGNDVYSLVMRMFQEPAMLSASEHGLHVDELFRRLGLPKNQIMDAINYLVDVGHIYSTVDEYHFKSANNC